VPDGVINIVTTQQNVHEVGREMCESKIVRKVSFTGSTPVAKALYGMAASTLKKCVVFSIHRLPLISFLSNRVSIEAGGNSPFIVFDDADIEQAVQGNPSFTTFVRMVLNTPTKVLSHANSVVRVRHASVPIASTSNPLFTPTLLPAWQRRCRHLKLGMASTRQRMSCSHACSLGHRVDALIGLMAL
jgi:hypothetical protein